MWLKVLQAIHAMWPWFFPMLMVILGAVIGSFFTCALYRLPQGKSLRQPPSFCDSCQTTLTFLDLIPVFSWAMLRGKCRHCGVKISAFYTGIELVTIIVSLGAFALAGVTLYLPVILGLFWGLEFWMFYKFIKHKG